MIGVSSRISPTALKVRFQLALFNSYLQFSAVQAGTGSLFSLALLMAFIRTYVRLKKFRRMFLDDVVFLFAVVCLVAVIVLLNINAPFLYGQLDPSGARYLQRIARQRNILAAYTYLSTAVVSSIKYVFMLQFWRLVRRVDDLKRWWRYVMVALTLATLIVFLDLIIVCPFFGLEALSKSIRNSYHLVGSCILTSYSKRNAHLLMILEEH